MVGFDNSWRTIADGCRRIWSVLAFAFFNRNSFELRLRDVCRLVVKRRWGRLLLLQTRFVILLVLLGWEVWSVLVILDRRSSTFLLRWWFVLAVWPIILTGIFACVWIFYRRSVVLELLGLISCNRLTLRRLREFVLVFGTRLSKAWRLGNRLSFPQNRAASSWLGRINLAFSVLLFLPAATEEASQATVSLFLLFLGPDRIQSL